MPRQKIVTFLWFDNQAEEAARFYVSIFKNSRLKRLVPGPGGSVLIVEFQLAGIDYLALNGGPQVKFNEAISLSVECDDQAEVDDLWERLSEGGTKVQCGWLKDKYGLSWQVVPACLPEMMRQADPPATKRVMDAVMKMAKLDIATLQAAYDGKSHQ